MKLADDVNFSNIGPQLTIAFAVLIALILGGNGLLLWQFHIARLQTDRLTGANQQVISVLRLQQGLLSFHQRLEELAQSRDARTLTSEAEPLRTTLLEQIARTKSDINRLPPETHVDPALLPTLDAIEITLQSQLQALTELAKSGDWDAVNLRLASELQPLESHTSELVKSTDEEVSGELTETVANMRRVQLRIYFIVPATAICTFFIAAFLGWAISRRLIDLRFEERVSERTRLARDLHDTLLQTIQASKMVADDALDENSDPADMLPALTKLSNWLGLATEEGRAALNSLRISTAQKNDLIESMQKATETFVTSNSLKVAFVAIGAPREMYTLLREEVFRIGCEAIRNACQHSEGDRVDVELGYTEDFVLRVSDNGKGIPPQVADKGKQGHFGLRGMRERAVRIGGKFNLTTSPTSGTEITVRIPGFKIFCKAGAPPTRD
jgi:signal transduction histidine kinase